MVGSPLYRATSSSCLSLYFYAPSPSYFESTLQIRPSSARRAVALYSLIDFDHPFFGISECLRLGTNIEKAKNFDDA